MCTMTSSFLFNKKTSICYTTIVIILIKKYMKLLRFIPALVFALALVLPQPVSAYEIVAENSIIVPQNKVVDGNLYAAGNNISIDGNINGDVVCAGQNIVINGDVAGSVLCAGQSIFVNGNIDGSVRVLGNSINIESNISRNLMTFGSSVILGESSQVGWDMLVGAAFADIKGLVGKNLHGGAAKVNITGKVNGNVDLVLSSKLKNETKGFKFNKQSTADSNLVIGEAAVIGGQLKYESNGDLKMMPGAQISGKINRIKPDAKKSHTSSSRAWGIITHIFYSILSTLLIGYVIIRLWAPQVKKITDLMLKTPSAHIGRGIVILLLTPIVALLLLITIIGIPLAFLLVVVWLIVMCLAKLLVAIIVGKKILEKHWIKNKTSLLWALVIGILCTKLIFAIPLIGWALSFVATLWGVGATYKFVRK